APPIKSGFAPSWTAFPSTCTRWPSAAATADDDEDMSMTFDELPRTEPQADASRAAGTGGIRRRRRWLWVMVFGAAGLTVFLLFLSGSLGQTARRKTAEAQALRDVPVVAAPARKGD